MRTLSYALVAWLMVGVASAQRTWIVDRLNRPGTDFTDMQPAVDAASSGDVIQVEYVDFNATQLYYEAPSVVGKSLVIRGNRAHRPPVVGRFEVRDLALNQSVSIAFFANGDQLYDTSGTRARPYRGIQAANCRGPVRIENMIIGCPWPCAAAGVRNAGGQGAGLGFEQCDMVTVSNTNVYFGESTGFYIANRSRVVIQGSYFGGAAALDANFNAPAAAYLIDHSELWLVSSTLIGQDGWSYPPLGVWYRGGAGIVACESMMHVGAGSRVQGGYNQFYQENAIGFARYHCGVVAGTGDVWIDPRATISGAVTSTATVHNEPVPGLAWFLGDPATSITFRQWSDPWSVTMLAMSEALPVPAALPQGLLFLDPANLTILAVSPGNAAGLTHVILPLSPIPPIGMSVAVQGAELTPSGTVKLSHMIAPGNY